MKTAKNSKPSARGGSSREKRAPKVTLHRDNPAAGTVISVGMGANNPRRDVALIMHRTGKDGLFFICDVGIEGREKWMQWSARISPQQIDNLISCFSVARREAKKLGWLDNL